MAGTLISCVVIPNRKVDCMSDSLLVIPELPDLVGQKMELVSLFRILARVEKAVDITELLSVSQFGAKVQLWYTYHGDSLVQVRHSHHMPIHFFYLRDDLREQRPLQYHNSEIQTFSELANEFGMTNSLLLYFIKKFAPQDIKIPT
jgi:hypothetical protein